MKKLITAIFVLLVLTLPLCALAADSSVSTPNISVTTTTGSATFTLKSDSPKATIYYTTDGSDPDTHSKKYSKSVKITTSCEVRAVAVESGEYSSVGYYTVTVTKARAATPTFKSTNVDGGKKITITSSGATIYYTTDGTTPSTYSEKYTSSGIIVSESCTIKAIAVRSGYSNSAVATALVTISKLGLPSYENTTSGSKTVIKLSNSISGCTYYYTTDGSDPEPKTSSSCKKSTGSITVTQAGTIKVIACKAGYAPSNVRSITVKGPEMTAPVPSYTDVMGGKKVTLKSSISGATIYYTTDGTYATTFSPKYTSSGITITKAGTTTIHLLVEKSGYTSKQFSFSVSLSKLAMPSATATSTTSSGYKLTINGPTGSTIYYTTNGVDPTTSGKSVKAGGTITVTAGTKLKLIAAMKGYANSDVYSATIAQASVAMPTVSETKYTDYNKVTLKCSTSGATIYYTLDGRDPLNYGTAVKSGTSITVDHSCTLRAIAVKEGMTNSAILEYNVTLKGDDITILGFGFGSDSDSYEVDIDSETTTDDTGVGFVIISDDEPDVDAYDDFPEMEDQDQELEIKELDISYEVMDDIDLGDEDVTESFFDLSLYDDADVVIL